MNKKITLITALVAALTAAPALADHRNDDNRDNQRQTEYARVVSAKPIYRQVRVSVPREECVEERVVYRDRSGARDGNVLLGAIIGGVAGHQFGRGRGNAAATAAGALIGAGVAQDSWGRPVRERVAYEPRCNTYEETRYEERVEGYDVTYKYHGRLYHTRMSHDPGSRIPVDVAVSPAHGPRGSY